MDYNELNKEYMKKYKDGDYEYLWKLVDLNIGICRKFAHKYNGTGLEQDDLISIAKIALIKVIGYFNPDKGFAFSTFAYLVIGREFKRRHRDMKRRNIDTITMETPLYENLTLEDILVSEDLPPHEEVMQKETALLVRETIDGLSGKEKEVIKRLFIHNQTQREVGKAIGEHQAQVSRIRKRALNKLKIRLERAIA